MHVTVHDVIVDGDRVAGRGTISGTHRGEFMGIPATGKPINVAYIDIWRAEGDKMVENWVQIDLLGIMQQLGVAPGPGQ
jgi:predicted ester cyclase